MELAKEVRDAGVRLRQSFQHHLGLGASMLGQQDFAEPSLAHDLQNIELVDQIHLFDRVKRKDSAVLNLNKIGRMANIKDTMRQLLFCIEIWKMCVFFWFEVCTIFIKIGIGFLEARGFFTLTSSVLRLGLD